MLNHEPARGILNVRFGSKAAAQINLDTSI
jgi:hypothetical protein